MDWNNREEVLAEMELWKNNNVIVKKCRRALQAINEKDVKEKEPKPKDDLDLNNDGVVDKKDASIAGKVLARSRKKKPKKVKEAKSKPKKRRSFFSRKKKKK